MDALKFLPLELSRKPVPIFHNSNVEEPSCSPSVPSRGLCTGGYSIAFGHPLLLSRTPGLCLPGPHTGARARRLLPFKGHFSTWHLPIAGESNKFPLVCVFTVIPSILIPGRSISLGSQRRLYTPFISTQPQSYVCPQEETFPMQRMTQTGSKQTYKDRWEKWTVNAVYKRWHLSYQSDSCSLWSYKEVLWYSDSEAHPLGTTDLEYEKTAHAEKVIFNKTGWDCNEAHSHWVAFSFYLWPHWH